MAFTTFPIPTIPFDQAPFSVNSSGTTRSLDQRFTDIVNVKDWGAVGDGVADDTAAIQAAIDFAYGASHQVTYLPSGKYKITSTIYLDAPGLNWRASGGPNMTFSAFSMSLQGDPGGANVEGFGTQILPTFNNAVALAIGPGRGMGARNLLVSGPFFGNAANYHRGGLPAAGVGIGIPSGSAGTSRTYFENVYVQNFYNGILTGMFSGNLLDDSNTFVKCLVGNAFNCWNFSGRENYINTLFHCQGGGTNVITAPTGADVWVFGGNLSTADGWLGALSVSGMSGITWSDPGTLGGAFAYWFDITVGAETTSGGTPAAMGLGVYTAYAMLTTHHGVIPLFLSSWNAGTRVARFYLNIDFSNTFYGGDNSVGNTALAADMAAQSVIYAVERTTTFQGNNVHVHGQHIENPDIATCLFDTFGTGVGGLRYSELRNFFYNSQPVLTQDYSGFSPGDARLGNYLVSISHPFIRVDQGHLHISDGLFGGGEPFAASVNNAQGMRLSIHRTTNPQLRAYAPTRNGVFDTGTGELVLNSFCAGVGESDACNYHTHNGNVEGADNRKYAGQSLWLGYRPLPGNRPPIRPEDADTLINGVPAVTWTPSNTFSTSQAYQLLWGGQVYHINHPQYEAASGSSGPQKRKFYSIVSDHHFYTYGQTISFAGCSFSYVGRSYCVYADASTLNIVFPGLGIIIADGSVNGSTLYVVTGVYFQLGYFTIGSSGISNGSPDTGRANLFGTAGTAFGPLTSISQEPYSIRKVDRADQINYQTPLTGTSITLDNLDTDVIINPAGTIAAFGITMMPNPYDQDKVSIRTTQTITALTFTPNAGQSLAGNPTTLAAGHSASAIFRKANTTWYFG